jgi:hypothetical protein
MKTILINLVLVGSLLMMSGCGEGNTRSSSYQDLPTYQEWQNVEAFSCILMILEAMVNGSGNNSCFTYPYSWEQGQIYGRYGYYEPWMR